MTLLGVALIGCGKIADQHMEAIRRAADAKVVAVCDREPLMAEQLAERYQVEHSFADAAAMLDEVQPDVVHVTTPPDSHLALGRLCLEAGCHVYIEKPFALNAEDALQLLELAKSLDRKIVAGHNLQFTLEMQKMRRMVDAGFLGGPVVHVESHFSYDLGDIRYASAFLGSESHWLHRLPGKLFQNVASHGIARVAEFLDELSDLSVTAFQSQRLAEAGIPDIQDEFRVLVRDSKNTTALFSLTTSVAPGLNQLRIYGPKNSILVDLAYGAVIPLRGRPYSSYLTYFIPPVFYAGAYLRNAGASVINFLRRRLYQDSGMGRLVSAFYESIRARGPAPVTPREILLVTSIMDQIHERIRSGTLSSAEPDPVERLEHA